LRLPHRLPLRIRSEQGLGVLARPHLGAGKYRAR
jgi:hypothetical protein